MQKKNFIIIALILINIFLLIKYITLTTNILTYNGYASSNILEKKISNEDEKQKYKINIYYPISDYPVLNDTIITTINHRLNEFKKIVDLKSVQPNQIYTLDILYTKYEYNNYLSYVFRVSEYTGGAHPNHTIFTISYDKNNNKMIDITSLVSNNDNLLNLLSNISRSILKENELFNDNKIFGMMLDGTKPNLENFRNFVFSKEGLLIFFEQYKIAPYSYGEFNVLIPYSNLNIK